MVLVSEMAMPEASAATMCEVPCVSRISMPLGSYASSGRVLSPEILERIVAAVSSLMIEA